MKMAISFISGVIICSLIMFFGVKVVLPIRAETDNTTEISENVSQGLLDLLPDIEKIYREALTTPFEKAESKIYDEDIAEFYHELLENTVLGEQGEGTN